MAMARKRMILMNVLVFLDEILHQANAWRLKMQIATAKTVMHTEAAYHAVSSLHSSILTS